MKSVCSNLLEDFIKMFLPTLIVAFFYFQFKENTHFLLLLLGFTFFIDTGHVYTTYVETFLDKNENKKMIHYIVLIMTYLLNFIIYNYANWLFYHYIFYYTVFHNARQGMGVSLLYKKEEDDKIKYVYYFLTFVPFLLFHFISPFKEKINIGEGIFKSFNWSNNVNIGLMENLLYLYGIISLILMIYVILIRKKNIQSYLVATYFGILYSLSFMVVRDPIFAFAILVVSHSVPYVFLMNNRVNKTHSYITIQKYSLLFIMLFFIVGGTVEYYYQDFLSLIDSDFHKMIIPLFWTPTIGHFIIDSYIWTRNNDKMKMIKKHRI